MELPAHQLSMTVLMTPDTANFSGNVHGGTILKLLDQVAYACASRYAGRYVVTRNINQVRFRQPIYVGELVTFLASVNHTGNSSMEIGIKVIAEEIRTRNVRHVNSCFFTMVAVDDDRRPVQPIRSFASTPVVIEDRLGNALHGRSPTKARQDRLAGWINGSPVHGQKFVIGQPRDE